MTNLIVNNSIIIDFHKRFANGEQHLYLSPNGDIEPDGKTYFWQERGVYNRIKPIIETIKLNNPSISELQLYAKNGIVSQLVPIQRAYNAIKNRKHEYINKLAFGVMIVEDGSIDLDNLEYEGLAPGKIIVYRQGSISPKIVNLDTTVVDILQQEEDRLLDEFDNAVKALIKRR